MGKLTLREIRKSLGRYLAIFAIVALGVGFFCGLRLTKTAMIRTLDRYAGELSLYDLRLVSTLGLTGDDVEAARAEPGVAAAEGSVSLDALASVDAQGNLVFRCISMPEQVNTLRVDAGRLPEKADECAADAWSYSASDIGKTVTISAENDQDTLDKLKNKTFTIVGIVHSPLYINYERGGTSLGSGSVAAFLFLPKAAMDTSVYTDLYLTLQSTAGLEVYSQPYRDAVDAEKGRWETFLEQRAALRQQSLRQDAQQEVRDAQNTLKDSRIALLKAGQTLSDGKIQYARGRLDYEAGLTAWHESRTEAEQQLQAARQKLTDGEAELKTREKTLEDGKTALAAAETKLQSGAAELQSGWDEYNAGVQALSEQSREAEQKLAETDRELTAASDSLSQSQSQLDAQKAVLDAQAAQLPTDTSGMTPEQQAGVAAARAQLQAGYQQLAAAQAQLTAGENQLISGRAQYRQAQSQLAEQTAAAEQKLDAAKARLEESQRQYDESKAALEQQQSELAAGETKLREAASQLKTGWADYDKQAREAREKLQQAGGRLAEAGAGLTGSIPSLRAGDAQLADGLRKLRDGEEALSDGQAALAGLSKLDTYVLTRDANVGYVCFESDSDIVRGVSRVFPLFFFMVAALVCITTMTRMVEEQRTQIGVLKALGYGKGAVFSVYLLYAGSASVLGCAAGSLAGSYFLPRMIWQAYNIMYGFTDILWAFDWPLVLVSSLGYLACALLATWYACNHELSRPAAELMRPKAPKAGRRVLLERVGFLWKRIPFLHKVSIRNILRYKKRMVVMAIGIGGCTALLLTGYGIRDSIQDVVNYQYEEITKYDLTVTFRDPMDAEAQKTFSAAHGQSLGSILYLSQSSMDCTLGSVTKSVGVTAAEGSSTEGFFDLHAGEEKLAYPKDGECLINSGLAAALSAKTGSTLTLRDSDGRQFTVKVAGVFDNYVYNYVFLTPATLARGLGAEPEVKTAWVCAPEGGDVHAAAAALAGDEAVSGVQVNLDLRERVGNMMDSLKYIVYVVITCAGALAFIVLYNLTNINITERLREIATVKVLGFYEPETRAYVFRENIVLTAMGILVGYPMGIWLHRYVMSQIKIDMVTFEVRILPVSYLYAAAFTVAFSLIVNFVMSFRIRSIRMAEALKSIE